MNNTDDNPFDLLGMEKRFDLDESDMHRRFLLASAEVHPDRSTDPEEQLELARQSARLNQAYQTLKQPESRAAALLQAIGNPTIAQHNDLPDGFLQQMLLIREDMEEAQSSQNQTKLDKLDRWAKTERKQYLDRVAELFNHMDADGTTHEIRLQLNALRYIDRMIEQLDPDYDAMTELD